jgi:DNA mismatch endonuclease (patch repair protein)
MTSESLRFTTMQAASPRASAAARAASLKSGNQPEMILRRALWRAGLRYRLTTSGLPGSPDLAYMRARVAVFCDGDFWHGRGLEARLRRLSAGHNSSYWVAKIRRNVERDATVNGELGILGWQVLRFWEGDIKQNVEPIVHQIRLVLIRRVGQVR